MLVSAGTMAALFAFGTNEKEEEQQAKQVEIQTKTPLVEEIKEDVIQKTIDTTETTTEKKKEKPKVNIIENTASNVCFSSNSFLYSDGLQEIFFHACGNEWIMSLDVILICDISSAAMSPAKP